MNKISVLFLCVHNSARSQMAEAMLKQMGGSGFEVESAGLEPGKLNLIVILSFPLSYSIQVGKNPLE